MMGYRGGHLYEGSTIARSARRFAQIARGVSPIALGRLEMILVDFRKPEPAARRKPDEPTKPAKRRPGRKR